MKVKVPYCNEPALRDWLTTIEVGEHLVGYGMAWSNLRASWQRYCKAEGIHPDERGMSVRLVSLDLQRRGAMKTTYGGGPFYARVRDRNAIAD